MALETLETRDLEPITLSEMGMPKLLQEWALRPISGIVSKTVTFGGGARAAPNVPDRMPIAWASSSAPK
jgi:hypothetical protein